jgi:hypothetical protein
MDPNAALNAIIRGHMVEEHVEALIGWLANGGFAPQVEVPDDPYAYMGFLFVEFAKIISADDQGITYYGRNPDGSLVYITTLKWAVFFREYGRHLDMGDKLDKREKEYADEDDTDSEPATPEDFS